MIAKLSNWITSFSASEAATPSSDHDWAETVAALLVEAAMADGEFDASERAMIAHALTHQLALPEDEVEAIITRAAETHEDRIEIHSITREIRAQTEAEDRIAIMEMAWLVVLSDGEMDAYESQLMRRLAGLLYVDDVDSGKAAKRAKARLAA